MDKEVSSPVGHRERMRNLVREKGLDALAPHQVIEFLLFTAVPRKDTKKIAYALLNKFGSLDGILSASELELKSVSGMTENAVVLLRYLPDFFNYYQKFRFKERPVLSAQDILPYLLTLFDKETEEVLYLVCLDIKQRLIHSDLIAGGTSLSVQSSAKKIVETAMRHRAKSVIIAHNHPSEILSPSEEDIKSTFSLGALLDSLDIKLLDHIIIGNRSAYSFYLKSRLVAGGISSETYPFIKIEKKEN
ncbi:hypothetical protein EOM82_04075 [bacterium]|nr:hypothetical protein [bacterium]